MEEKTELTGAICISENHLKAELSFEEILLDERLVQGDIWVLKEALRAVGGLNYRLMEKREYELLIRIAGVYKVRLLNREDGIRFLQQENADEAWIQLKTVMPWEGEMKAEKTAGKEAGEIEEGLKTDCYLLGRYRQELTAMNVFDDAVLGILSSCAQKEALTEYLKKMIAQTDTFYYIYDCTQPVLIYTGCDLCYNILDTFSAQLGNALEKLGQKVMYFNLAKQSFKEISSYAKRRFKAVIGMQTNMFYAKWETGRFVHDDMPGPKYNFLFDHPIMLKNYLDQKPYRLYSLTPDGNYAKFIEKYFESPARFLPPGGEDDFSEANRKDYEVVFLGSYGEGPLENLKFVRKTDRQRGYLVNRYILYMRKYLEKTPEQAFEEVLTSFGRTCSKKELIALFHQERWVITELANYYRNKLIKILLEMGIAVHVFGKTWKECPMQGHPGLIQHPAVYGKDALNVYARAKVSLNVMRWHKDGFTERIANAMLQKAAVVTDRTTYLEENFVDGKDIILFDLGHLQEVPNRIKNLLACEEKRKQIAKNGYEKALAAHTWKSRAAKILEMIEEDETNRDFWS